MEMMFLLALMFLVWLYVTDVVLDGNTHGKALNTTEGSLRVYAGEQKVKCVRTQTRERKTAYLS